ncbi:MAG: hypothetical protein RSD07_12775, partial [Angelakisella sp.]
MYLKKEDRAIVLPLAWFLCFLLVNLVLCALQHFTVTFSLLIENLTQFLWIKLLFPSIFTFILSLLPSSDLSDIKSKTTGDGQHGTARMATELEKQAYYEYVKPSHEKVPGFVVGLEGNKQWIVDVSDKNLLLNAPPGTGKTTRIVVPNLYYNAAVNVNTGGKGASMLLTDMKGDLVKICGAMLEQCGYS